MRERLTDTLRPCVASQLLRGEGALGCRGVALAPNVFV